MALVNLRYFASSGMLSGNIIIVSANLLSAYVNNTRNKNKLSYSDSK